MICVLGVAAGVGCSTAPYGTAASGEAIRLDRAVNADLTAASMAWLCRGISIRQWLIEFGGSADRALAWETMCAGQSVEQIPRMGASGAGSGSAAPGGRAP